MKKLTFVILLITALNVFALENKITSAISNNLKINLPEVHIDQINPTKVANVYEVVSGNKVFYVDGTGQYAMLGNLVDLSTKKSLTEERVRDLTRVDWKGLPLNLAIPRVIGQGTRHIAIFTDPDCPFCRNLEVDTVANLKDVTVYYFLFPLDIHTNAKTHSKQIICSETPDKALTTWMKSGTGLTALTTCKNAARLDTIINYATNVLHLEAAPTIILPNGEIIAGVVPPDYLNQRITETTLPSNVFIAPVAVPSSVVPAVKPITGRAAMASPIQKSAASSAVK